MDPLFSYLLRLGDNALVLGHRLSEWTGRAPMLEEELALANMGLDLIGQARLFYSYAGEVEGKGRDEDAFAYLRLDGEWGNVLLVEQPNGDFALTMLRQLFFAAYAEALFRALVSSRDARLAEIAAKAVKEMTYHVRHSAEWVIRLADGTQESRSRMLDALDELWPYTGELFEADEVEQSLITSGIAADPALLEDRWGETIDRVFSEANLQVPAMGWMHTGGRKGIHSEHLGHMLAAMQSVHRAFPGVTW
jgi:ring-1,2-phenylacetyl-CoA epoxidase subunit PaaC